MGADEKLHLSELLRNKMLDALLVRRQNVIMSTISASRPNWISAGRELRFWQKEYTRARLKTISRQFPSTVKSQSRIGLSARC